MCRVMSVENERLKSNVGGAKKSITRTVQVVRSYDIIEIRLNGPCWIFTSADNCCTCSPASGYFSAFTEPQGSNNVCRRENRVLLIKNVPPHDWPQVSSCPGARVGRGVAVLLNDNTGKAIVRQNLDRLPKVPFHYASKNVQCTTGNFVDSFRTVRNGLMTSSLEGRRSLAPRLYSATFECSLVHPANMLWYYWVAGWVTGCAKRR